MTPRDVDREAICLALSHARQKDAMALRHREEWAASGFDGRGGFAQRWSGRHVAEIEAALAVHDREAIAASYLSPIERLTAHERGEEMRERVKAAFALLRKGGVRARMGVKDIDSTDGPVVFCDKADLTDMDAPDVSWRYSQSRLFKWRPSLSVGFGVRGETDDAAMLAVVSAIKTAAVQCGLVASHDGNVWHRVTLSLPEDMGDVGYMDPVGQQAQQSGGAA